MDRVLSDADFLFIIEATGCDFDLAARLTGWSKAGLHQRARHPRLRRPVAEARDRLAARGALRTSNPRRNRDDDNVTAGEIAKARDYTGHGRKLVDLNPSVPLAKISSLVQGGLRQFYLLLESATSQNLGEVYAQIHTQAEEFKKEVGVISELAEEGMKLTRRAGG